MRFLCVLLLVGLVATPTPNMEKGRASLSPATDRLATDAEAPGGRLVPAERRSVPPPATFGRIAAIVPVVRGFATWYDAPSPQDAAAGPSLRKALGRHWRGSTVRVCADECVTVRLTDWCACGSRHGTPTVIDLDDVAFSRIAKLSAGVVRVRVSVLGQIDVPLTRPAPTAPPTNVGP